MVSFSSKPLATWLDNEFGRGAKNKKLPQWVIELPKEKIQVVFETYMNGDGYHVSKGQHKSRNVKTISENLVHGIRSIALRLGYKTSIWKHAVAGNPMILGRQVKINPYYELYLNEPNPYKFNTKMKVDFEYQYQKIRVVQKMSFSGTVYNLEVEEDHSYCFKSCTVHDCSKIL